MGYVYVLRSGSENLFKIGRTDGDVDARIRQLATGNPHPLTKFDVIQTEHDSLCETYLHRMLRSRKSLASDAREFFAITPAELAPVIRDAREFLAEFVAKQAEADRLAEAETDGVLLKPGDPEWSVYRSLLAAREEEDTYRYQRQLLENTIKIAIGRSDGLESLATWKTQTVERLDQAALKSAQPDVFKMYAKTSRVRVFRLM
ncbi:MAG: hypothetical protein DMD81_03255 [Candidatus Rokuibacteriota bacterium]|nr:MAG: hypothetical protein DMD81_03255 [Candidatus Rokubacteria bacterium]